MPEQDTATFAVYADRLSTGNALDSLRAAGFRNSDIVTLFPDELGTWQFFQRTRRRSLRSSAAVGLSIGVFVAILSAVWLAMGVAGTFLAIVALGGGGSFIGALTTRRTEDYQERYEGRVRHGDILVTVHCTNPQWAEKAHEILSRTGGDDVSTSDKVRIGFVKSNRIVVRPASEKTALRLVTPEDTRWGPVGFPRTFGGSPQKIQRDQPRRV